VVGEARTCRNPRAGSTNWLIAGAATGVVPVLIEKSVGSLLVERLLDDGKIQWSIVNAHPKENFALSSPKAVIAGHAARAWRFS